MTQVPASSHGAAAFTGGTIAGPLNVNTAFTAGFDQITNVPLAVSDMGGKHYEVDVQSDAFNLEAESGALIAFTLGTDLIFARNAAPADASLNAHTFSVWLDDTANAPKVRWKVKDSGATVFSKIMEDASPIASGALPTVALVSGTGTQILVARAVETITPVTFNPGAATTATCTVAISPDNVTYSTLGVETEPAGVAFDGTIHLIKVRVPAGWYLKLTVNAQAVLGTTTYY